MDRLMRLIDVVRCKGALRQLLTSKIFSISSFQISRALSAYENDFKSIIDAGANQGQFAMASSYRFPKSKIYSFEPVPETFAELVQNTKGNNIECFQYALGDETGQLTFYQNNYSHVSSALKISEENDSPQYDLGIKNELKVPVYRLDDIVSELNVESPCLLKLDVQGLERQVLRGAMNFLEKVDYVLLEVSFVKLYDDQPLFSELDSLLNGLGFSLLSPVDFHRGARNIVIEMDVLYKRDK
ncbi:MAG: FkbM family methyltransferase [Cyclobacteriaceae bacterium]